MKQKGIASEVVSEVLCFLFEEDRCGQRYRVDSWAQYLAIVTVMTCSNPYIKGIAMWISAATTIYKDRNMATFMTEMMNRTDHLR